MKAYDSCVLLNLTDTEETETWKPENPASELFTGMKPELFEV